MCVGRVLSENNVFDFPARTKLEKVPSNQNKKLNFPEGTQDNENIQTQEVQFSEDILAVMTYYTKDILFGLNECFKSFSNSSAFKILCHTTQPAHIVTSLAVLFVSFLCLSNKSQIPSISPVWTLLYLGSFSAHFGAQIWMTFISGLALYFSLPRHTFGSVQQVLFPKYFLLNAMLSLVTLAIFLRVKNNELRTLETGVQAFAMSLCFLTELLIFLYLTPPLLQLITVKTEIEKEAGVGMEVGKLDPGKLLKCPHYVKIHKTFRKLHMSIAIGNILTMGCTTLHLYYLACKLCVLSL